MVCPGSYPQQVVMSLSIIQSGTADALVSLRPSNTANRDYMRRNLPIWKIDLKLSRQVCIRSTLLLAMIEGPRRTLSHIRRQQE
jgi:hypothetical protein